jgi:acetylornithine deacetylase/succinyl-diaminopimelate desuccinylase-like protein
MIDEAIRHAEEGRSRFVSRLGSLISIPSCSFAGFPRQELQRSAEAVAGLLREAGLENVQLLSAGEAPPYVYGDWLRAPGKPTVLLYAHHDVQPAGDEGKWKSPPHQPCEREGRLYGRGSADDKAGIVVHAASIESYLKTSGRLPVNVKVIIEGEEESGSASIDAFLKKYAGLLKADLLVIADSGNYATGVPTITTSLRGLVSVDVEVCSARQSLHSGSWGGPVPDPVQALARMIASLSDKNGRIAIPGIYDGVRPLSSIERKSFASLRYGDALYRRQAGVLPGVHLIGGKASALEKMWRLPSLSVNAIEASSRKGAANVVNDKAWCRIGVRTVPDMDGGKVRRLLCAHLKKNAPWGVKVSITPVALGPWWGTDPSGAALQSAARAMRKGYGKDAVFIGAGGSIGFVKPFCKAIGGAPALLVGVEDPLSNAHSENESVDLSDLQKSIVSSIHLYSELAGG